MSELKMPVRRVPTAADHRADMLRTIRVKLDCMVARCHEAPDHAVVLSDGTRVSNLDRLQKLRHRYEELGGDRALALPTRARPRIALAA